MMSLRVRPREAEISSRVDSYGLGKPSKTSILKLSKRALGMILGVLIFYTILDILNTPTPPSHPEKTLIILSNDEKPLKLYVYDLPHRFTYGVIEHGTIKDTTRLAYHYPVHQHMAEWLVFTDLIRPDSERVGSPVIRVRDPDEAELFYVPFFSSLSVLAARMRPEAYDDEETQKAVIEWLGMQEYWKRNGGRDHVIAASDPDSYGHVIEEVVNCTMLLGGLRTNRGSLVKDVVAPYAHRIGSYTGDIGLHNRNTLLFFMGAKEDGRTRKTLVEILEKEDDVVIMKEAKEDLTRGIQTSKFCLNPTSRLFESIVGLCIPVIVGGAVELPFEDVIDYTKIAVFISADDALNPGFLVSLLRTVPDHQIIEYQKQLREVIPYFEFRSETIDQIWREITHKLPFIKLMINRQRRLVSNSNLGKPFCPCSNKTIGITKCML